MGLSEVLSSGGVPIISGALASRVKRIADLEQEPGATSPSRRGYRCAAARQRLHSPSLDPTSRVVIADLQGFVDQVEEGWPATGPSRRAFPRIWEWPWQHLEPGLLERPMRAKHVIVAGEEHLAAWYTSE